MKDYEDDEYDKELKEKVNKRTFTKKDEEELNLIGRDFEY